MEEVNSEVNINFPVTYITNFVIRKKKLTIVF